MPIEQKLFKAEGSDDPRKCITEGCPFLGAEGTDPPLCVRHGANKQLDKAERENIRLYRVAKWQGRIAELADSPKRKSLTEEVGVLRMVLEEVLNRCKTDEDIFMMSTRISELVRDIEKVVMSCSRLEATSGQTLDKVAAMNFATQVLEILGRHVPVESLDPIAGELIDLTKSFK
jgi:hypothetical protein